MAKILFVVAPAYTTTTPHLGVAYLRSVAHAAGHETEYLDLSAEARLNRPLQGALLRWSEAFCRTHYLRTLYSYMLSVAMFLRPRREALAAHRPLYLLLTSEAARMVDAIVRRAPTHVAFSIYSSNVMLSLALAQGVKERAPEIITIAGGAFLVDPEGLGFVLGLAEGLDWVVVGEGEPVLPDLLNAPPNSSPQVITAPLVDDLAALPYPTFEGCDFQLYRRVMAREVNWRGLAALGENILPIVGRRGCRNACAFCAHRVVFKAIRSRPPESVVGELRQQRETYGCRVFRFGDSLLNGDVTWLRAVCEGVLQCGLEIYWYGACRADQLDPELARLMYRAGCRYLELGVESGSPRVLGLMNKHQTPETVRRGLTAATEANIRVRANLMYAYPGETPEDVALTLQFLRDNGPLLTAARARPFQLLPGTPMSAHPERYGIRVKCFETGDPQLDQLLHRLPETWSHPDIDEAEVQRRQDALLEAIGRIDQRRPLTPHIFMDLWSPRMTPASEVEFFMEPIERVDSPPEGAQGLVAVQISQGPVFLLNPALLETLRKKPRLALGDLVTLVAELNDVDLGTAEELTRMMVSVGMVRLSSPRGASVCDLAERPQV